ncbi:MAG: GNAT family N-acetyltransferase [Chitinophagaceae bacterium]
MINYRLATYQDNQQLIELTAASGMIGDISLRIDRKPDFFNLLHRRGSTKVFVAEDDNTIVGSLCVSLQDVYVGEQIFPLLYIGDFKVAAPYRNKGIGMQLCNEMASYVISMDADLAFLNISSGNTKPVSFFKDRPQVPDFENIGVFNIHQFIGKKRKITAPSFTIVSAPVTDELVQFFNSHYCKYEMGSVITGKKLEESECFVIRRDEEIIAAMCLLDTMGFKQNVVTGLSWKLKYLLKGINSVSRVSGISRMPIMNEPVRMMYIKHLVVNNHEKELVRLMIQHARNIVYKKAYSFVSVGLHEKDPLNKCFYGMLKLTFNSVGMLLSIKNNKVLIDKVKQGIPFEDYSLV